MTSLFYGQTNLIDLSEVLEHSLFALPCLPPEQPPHQSKQSWLFPDFLLKALDLMPRYG